MESIRKIDWKKYLTVNTDGLNKLLVCQQVIGTTSKLTTRLFTLKCSGTQYETTAFVNFVANSIPKYVFDETDIQRINDAGGQAYRESLSYFSKKDPVYQGKFGELILYLMTESVLGIPMIAHKIQIITNQGDEIKGGDGIFYGLYKDKPSILIGEAKVWGDFNAAIKDAFLSLGRFHEGLSDSTSSFEFSLARKNIKSDLSIEELNTLYNCFTPGEEEYSKSNKVHPVLIVYDEKSIASIDASDSDDFEEKIRMLIQQTKDTNEKHIVDIASNYSNVTKVYLDFFLIPMVDVISFKKNLFTAITGVEWKHESKTKKSKQRKP